MASLGPVIIGSGLTTLYHPIAYAKVLIQLGHEPIPPKLSTTLFGSRVYLYPNVFKYIKHIYKTNGFLGLYEGLGPKLVAFVISNVVNTSVHMKLTGKSMFSKVEEEIDDDEIESDTFETVLKDTSYEVIARCAAVVCSQPFYVISIRTMAQFVGSETRYSGIFAGISDIWSTEGISGFFSGLAPRLMCEALTIVIANFLGHAFTCIVASACQQPHNTFKTQSNMVSQVIASQMTYPINLVSVLMTVNNSGLAAASTPLMPIYENWWSCFKSLKANNQLKRGSSLFWRRYHGVKIYTQGVPMPRID